MEKKLIMIFNEKFKLVRGREYFLGEINEMIDIVYNEIKGGYIINDNDACYGQLTTIDNNMKLMKENNSLCRENKILKYKNNKTECELQRLTEKISIIKEENRQLSYKIYMKEDEINNLRHEIKENKKKNNGILEFRCKYEEDMKLKDNIITGNTKTIEYLESKINDYEKIENDNSKEMEKMKNMLSEYKREKTDVNNGYSVYIGYSVYSVYSVYLFVSYPIRYICNIFRR